MIKFIRQVKASISIEMTAIFSLFVMLIVLSGNVAAAITTQTKLNSLSYALACIIREQSVLYQHKKPSLSQDDAIKLYEAAKELLKDNFKQDIGLNIQLLSHDERDKISVIAFSAGEIECKVDDISNKADEIVFTSSFAQKTDVYMLSVCSSYESGFTKKLTQSVFEPLSTSIVYVR